MRGGGAKGRLEFFQNLIRFDSGILPKVNGAQRPPSTCWGPGPMGQLWLQFKCEAAKWWRKLLILISIYEESDMWSKYHDIYLATILVLKWFDNNLRVHFGIRNGVVWWVGWVGWGWSRAKWSPGQVVDEAARFHYHHQLDLYSSSLNDLDGTLSNYPQEAVHLETIILMFHRHVWPISISVS